MKNSIIALALSLSACATSYQPSGWSGGYTDDKIGDNKYLVSFEANGYTSRNTARKFALRRAQELCEENGFRSFETLNIGDASSTTRMPTQLNCATGICQTTGGGEITKPGTDLVITCK